MPQVFRFLQNLPDASQAEVFEAVFESNKVRIERITSQGQATSENQWYDQPNHEWVIVLKGSAVLEIQGTGEVTLSTGDGIDVPAHCRHRVLRTSRTEPTVWLAVHHLVAE